MRNIAARLPVNAETAFEIGSVSKQFTAAAILQLKEQGRLDLDRPVATYVPSFPHARALTVRQLLNQVSGLPDYTDGKGFDTKVSATPGSLEKVAAYASTPLEFAPGTRWEYSNTNYYVLSRVIEVIAKRFGRQ